jgi:uncharacterized protein
MPALAEIAICTTAFATAILTFFSGFGLGTILAPAMLLFFPVEMAITMTGIVHLVNNLFKFFLVGRHANWAIVRQFGIPALTASFFGAWLLLYLDRIPIIGSYEWWGRTREISMIKLSVAALLIGFSLMEVIPKLKNLQFDKFHVSLGGLLSGFFGGLSGHQGALRSAFLIRSGMSKESFIATGVVIAVLVDLTRLSVYIGGSKLADVRDQTWLIMSACLSAIVGATLGNFLIKKVTLTFLQYFVSVSVFLIAIALAFGLI